MVPYERSNQQQDNPIRINKEGGKTKRNEVEFYINEVDVFN